MANESRLRIAIYGVGAIGGFLAAGLRNANQHDISLVCRGKNREAILKHGLTLEDKKGNVLHVTHFNEENVQEDPRKLGPQDVVIVAVKAHQAWEAAEGIQSLLSENTTVVTAMNGVPWWFLYKIQEAAQASAAVVEKERMGSRSKSSLDSKTGKNVRVSEGWWKEEPLESVDEEGKQWKLIGPEKCLGYAINHSVHIQCRTVCEIYIKIDMYIYIYIYMHMNT